MKTTAPLPNSVLVLGLGLGLVFGMTACGSDFTPSSELRSLRVMAVQKHGVGADSDAPWSAAEGAALEMTMLAFDGRENRDADVQRLWFSGCSNPFGDAYYACFGTLAVMGLLLEHCQDALGPLPWTLEPGSDLNQATSIAECAPEVATLAQGIGKAVGARELGSAWPASLRIGSGSSFVFAIPDEVVLERDGTADFGVSHVFFTACAGRVGLVDEYRRAFESGELPSGSLVFPLGCYDDAGELRNVEHFVAGYTSVYSYADDAGNDNTNPPIAGAIIDGKGRAPDEACEGTPCPLGPKVCVGLDCNVETSCNSAIGCSLENPSLPAHEGAKLDCGDFAACVPVCTKRNSDDCPKHTFRPLLDKSSVLAGPGATGEQMWIRYYASKGSLSRDPVRLYDVNTGWNTDHGTRFSTPKEPGPFYVWSAVHDSRGGVNWVRASILAQ